MISNAHSYVSGFLLPAVLLLPASGKFQAVVQHPPAGQMATVGSASRVYPPSSGYRFPNGQTSVYSVEWHMFNAGVAKVTMDNVGNQQRVSAIADSLGVVNLMYTVHDRFESYFDPHTFCSEKITKHAEEGKRRKDSEIQFAYTRGKAMRTDKDLKTGEVKRTDSDIPSCVTDVITGFYYLASQQLIVGSSYTFPINEGGRTTDVKAQVETTEQVKVPAGNYQTLRITAEPISGTLKGKAKISVWFSNDATHIPVQMRAKLGWGTLLFRLQRLEKK